MSAKRPPFADRAIDAIRARATPLCVGIDPHPELVPAIFGDLRTDPGNTLTAWGEAVIAAAAGRVGAVKPQLGLFERFGPPGYAACRTICHAARAAGLLVLLDAKRCDIGSTAAGYADAAYGDAGFAADAITVNAYMGLDTLAPFLDAAQGLGRGVAVLVRTSNPGAGDVQDLICDGEPVWAHLARGLAPLSERLRGRNGWSGLMAVAGGTWPGEAQRLRALLPEALFLVPGYGAQGGDAAAAVAGFTPGPDGRLEGGFVNSARAILAAGVPATSELEWRQAVDAAIDASVVDLRSVCG